MKLPEIISETSKQIIWEMFYWAPYNYSTYFKQSKGHCPCLFPGIFLDLGLWLLLLFQLECLSFHDLSCAHGWISWNWLVTSLRNSPNLKEGQSWKEAINGRRTTRLCWERHPVAGITSLPSPPPKASDCLTYSWCQEGQTRRRHGLQRGSIYIPSWFTCFLQILQLLCRQINAVICFQQGGGNPLWHFLFLNSWSCFVFPKPYWSTRLMIVFLKALFCSLCHRGSPRNYN